MKISQTQKKIIVISLVILLAFLFFVFFIYLPSKDKVGRIKSELVKVKSQIQEIELILAQSKTIEEGIKEMRAKYQRFNSLFPPKEEQALKKLSDFAKELDVEVISISPQSRKEFLDNSGKIVKMKDKTCQCVFVSIKMRCLYKDLVRYIETLKEALPAFVRIEKLKINKDRPEFSKLDILLDLNLYLLS